MTMTANTSWLRAGHSQTPRWLRAAMLISVEYNRAIRAARHYDNLKSRRLAAPHAPRIGPGGIPRAVFEALYRE